MTPRSRCSTERSRDGRSGCTSGCSPRPNRPTCSLGCTAASATTSSGRSWTSFPNTTDSVTYALSVPAAFDLELSRLLLGDESVPVVRELLRLGIFLRIDDEQPGFMTYHGLVRTVLERELRTRDPAWHEQLVRRVASISVERGDLATAHAHLVSIADVGAAMRLVVSRAFSFVDRGDAEAVGRLALAFPPRADVADPSLALDMATLSFFAAQRDESREWCALAGQLVEPNDGGNLLRLHAFRALLALMDGALDDVDEHLRDVTLAAMDTAPPDDPITKWTSLTETRRALVSGCLHEAAIALDHARVMDAPLTVREVTVPALTAWLHLERGDLAGALALADAACAWADAEDVRYHHGVLEALVILGQCRLAAGDLEAAGQLARRSHAYAATLGYTWDVVRAGTLDAEVQRLGAGSEASLEVVTRLRSELADTPTRLVTEHLDRAEAAAMVDAGHLDAAHLDAAWTAIVRLPPGAWRSLLEARHATAVDDHRSVAAAVTSRTTWPPPLRLEAEVLLATSGSPRPQVLLAALQLGAVGGWVAPFLAHMTRIQQIIDGPSIALEHPLLAVAAAGLRRTTVGAADPLAATSLTAREQSLLEFLPSHLSYAQIAARTFLSVNTVKSNLKSIYRKLGVASRAEAVELARQAGLI